MSEPKDEDYIAGHYIVFADELGLTDDQKLTLNETAQLSVAAEGGVFGSEAGTLVVERRTRPNGNKYLFVRNATTREEKLFYAS